MPHMRPRKHLLDEASIEHEGDRLEPSFSLLRLITSNEIFLSRWRRAALDYGAATGFPTVCTGGGAVASLAGKPQRGALRQLCRALRRPFGGDRMTMNRSGAGPGGGRIAKNSELRQ
jgi:hypothetical protein